MSIADKLVTVTENMQKVYEAKQKAFWDEFIGEGKPMLYAFAGYNWTDANFRPTRNIVASAESAERMFYVNRLTNIKQSLSECGVSLDLSRATNLNGAFLYATTRELPDLDISSATNIANLFNSCRSLKVIDSVTFSQNVTSASAAFTLCDALEEIRIPEGNISFSGLDFHWSTKLDADSIASIIEALSDNTSGLGITLPNTAQATYSAKYSESAWYALIDTKRNWSISY